MAAYKQRFPSRNHLFDIHFHNVRPTQTKMKRQSEIVYASLGGETTFMLTPRFNFGDTGHSPRLVDYSFTDVSDSDGEEETSSLRLPCPLHKLQAELSMLSSKVTEVKRKHRRQPVQRRYSKHLKDIASLNLRNEEEKEKLRKDFVLRELNKSLHPVVLSSEDSLYYTASGESHLQQSSYKTRISVYDTERPSKKPKLDFSVFKRFSKTSKSRRSFHSKKQKKDRLLKNEDLSQTGCFLGLLRPRRQHFL